MKHRLVFHSLMLLAVFLALTSTVLASSTWYVDGVNGSDSNNCKSPETACKTIGHAISLASSCDSIMVAAATYTENLTIGISLRVIGAGATTTIIDGGGVNTVVTISSDAVALSGLTIQHGDAALGGGIHNSGTLTITKSTITGNQGRGYFFQGGGGGIYNSGMLTINNSTVSGNGTLFSGGGIYNSGMLTISKSAISGNGAVTAYNGGEIVRGGGIYNAGTLTLNNSTLSGNRATASGDFHCGQAYGGGIYSRSQTLTINNSTLSGNYARACVFFSGGGIDGNVTLQNSIVANSSSGGNCSGTMTSKGYNLSGDGTCNFNGTGDLNNTDPKLGTLGNYGGPTQTIPLLSGSPAIDAGNPSGCTDGNGHLLKTDQRGKPRPDKEDSGGCDMGAYERQTD